MPAVSLSVEWASRRLEENSAAAAEGLLYLSGKVCLLLVAPLSSSLTVRAASIIRVLAAELSLFTASSLLLLLSSTAASVDQPDSQPAREKEGEKERDGLA